MTTTMEQRRGYRGAPFFSFGFRPFFLGGALVAAVIPLLTALSFSGLMMTGTAYGPAGYHGHEMVFGYLGAVVSGFILTAVPNWTGRLPVLGRRLMALFALWAAGRLAILFSGTIGPAAAFAVDAPFLIVLSGVIWREVIAGKNRRNLPVCVLITTFAAANVVWHLGWIGGGTGAIGWRLGIGVIAVLLALIGGRITPSFTRNWLVKSGRTPPDIAIRPLDKAALAVIAVAMAAWVWAPLSTVSGVLLLAASALHLVRLARWQGWRTLAEPLVTVLHAGYLWLALSLALLGLSAIAPGILTSSTALHALTAGAAGVMTLAVMTRATLGHTGRELKADVPTLLIYALVNLGALARLAAGFVPAHYAAALTASAVLWGGAFVLFAAVYGRYLAAPRLDSRPVSAPS